MILNITLQKTHIDKAEVYVYGEITSTGLSLSPSGLAPVYKVQNYFSVLLSLETFPQLS